MTAKPFFLGMSRGLKAIILYARNIVVEFVDMRHSTV